MFDLHKLNFIAGGGIISNPNVKVVTEYSVTGNRNGGYRLKWVGPNKPSYIVGVKGTFGWYRYKKDAVSAAAQYN